MPNHQRNDETETAPLLPTPAIAAIVVTKSDPEETPLTTLRGLSIGFSLAILIFLQTANVSLLTTIQSAIADGVGDYTHVSWFTSAYLIAVSSITPLAGRLCQIFRPQSYMLLSSMVFATGLVITSAAPSLAVFLLGRVVTGIGAAGNFPVAMNVIISITGVRRRGLFMGGLNTCFTIGIAFGALIAGAMEPAVGWRAVFWLQTPLALAGGLGIYFALPAMSLAKHNPEKLSLSRQLLSIDYYGSVTLISLIVLLLFGLSSPRILPIPIAISIALLFLFIFIESRASHPIIPMTVLRSRGTLMTCFATLGMMVARWSMLFYAPQYFIAVRLWTPARAGLVLISTNGGFATGGLLVGWLHIRRAGSFYFSCLATFLLFAGILFLQSLLTTPTSSIPLFFILTFFNGLVVGASLNYTLVHVLHLTPPSTHPITTSLVAMFRGFAGSFGSAIGGGIFSRVLRKRLVNGFAEAGLSGREELVARLLGSPRLVKDLSGVEQVVARQGYADAVAMLFVAGSGLALAVTLLQAATGWNAATEVGAGKDVEDLDDEEGRGVVGRD